MKQRSQINTVSLTSDSNGSIAKPTDYPADWQTELSKAIRDPKQLFERLQINDESLQQQAFSASKDFKLFVTESYLKRIKLGDLDDPLLKQILPNAAELQSHPQYTRDPLAEAESTPIPGLLHKYQGRALIITNGHCAINCRFCFRRNFPYQSNHFAGNTEAAIYDYLRADPSIEEVILSGGDPLLHNTHSLSRILHQFEQIPHITRLLIHTRITIVLTNRINTALLDLFDATSLKIIMVIHCNHAQEIDQDVKTALAQIKVHCHSLLNQSVLLKGVNNDLKTLIDLQKALFDNQVQSYYLHILDKVKGAQHFDSPLNEAKSLYQALSSACSGYMLPKLVIEEAGASMKTLLSPHAPSD